MPAIWEKPGRSRRRQPIISVLMSRVAALVPKPSVRSSPALPNGSRSASERLGGATLPKRRKPVLFFWENIGPYHNDRLNALDAAGVCEVKAVQASPRSAVYQWDPVHRAEYHLESLFTELETQSPIRTVVRLVSQCLRARAKLVFLCHYERTAVLAAAAILKLLGRSVYAMVDSKFDDKPRSAFREFCKSAYLLPYDGALTASRRSRDYLSFLGLDPKRIFMGYDTLSIERIAKLAGEGAQGSSIPFEQRAFVCVARLVAKKNLQATLRAFDCWLAQTAAPRDLHLCGSGPLEAELRALAAELGIADRVHFHGFIQSAEVAAVLSRALCLLLTSTEEQYGLAVIEAQAAGVPVIVSRNAGAADIVSDGINGFTINPDDVESCAALMVMLSEDEQRWRRFSEAARTRADAGDCRHFVASVDRIVRRSFD